MEIPSGSASVPGSSRPGDASCLSMTGKVATGGNHSRLHLALDAQGRSRISHEHPAAELPRSPARFPVMLRHEASLGRFGPAYGDTFRISLSPGLVTSGRCFVP